MVVFSDVHKRFSIKIGADHGHLQCWICQLIDFVAASKTRPNKQFINISEHNFPRNRVGM